MFVPIFYFFAFLLWKIFSPWRFFPPCQSLGKAQINWQGHSKWDLYSIMSRWTVLFLCNNKKPESLVGYWNPVRRRGGTSKHLSRHPGARLLRFVQTCHHSVNWGYKSRSDIVRPFDFNSAVDWLLIVYFQNKYDDFGILNICEPKQHVFNWFLQIKS